MAGEAAGATVFQGFYVKSVEKVRVINQKVQKIVEFEKKIVKLGETKLTTQLNYFRKKKKVRLPV